MRSGLFLGLLLLAGCVSDNTDLPALPFVADGVQVSLPAERNVPKDTVVKAGVEVIIYDDITWEGVKKIDCGTENGRWVGCTYHLDEDTCIVFLVAPSLIPPQVADRARKHEMLGHCNGHDHVMNGTVLEWVR